MANNIPPAPPMPVPAAIFHQYLQAQQNANGAMAMNHQTFIFNLNWICAIMNQWAPQPFRVRWHQRPTGAMPSQLSVSIQLPPNPAEWNTPPTEDGVQPPNILVFSRESATTPHDLDIYRVVLENLMYARRYQECHRNVQYGYIMAFHFNRLDASRLVPQDPQGQAQVLWAPFFDMVDAVMPNNGVQERLHFLIRGFDGLTINRDGLRFLFLRYQHIDFQFLVFQPRHTIPMVFSQLIHDWFDFQHLINLLPATRYRLYLENAMQVYVYPSIGHTEYFAALTNLAAFVPVGQAQLLLPHQRGFNAGTDLLNLWTYMSDARVGHVRFNSSRNYFSL